MVFIVKASWLTWFEGWAKRQGLKITEKTPQNNSLRILVERA